jgi:hypothetical protein
LISFAFAGDLATERSPRKPARVRRNRYLQHFYSLLAILAFKERRRNGRAPSLADQGGFNAGGFCNGDRRLR